MTCGCNDKCDLPKALQINTPGEVTLFHRVDVPASQGDDTTYPPKNGLYRNVLLVYLANNHSYLYNSDGIPTRVDGPEGPEGPGVAPGGETGQVLAKNSDSDYDTTWVTQTSANDAKLTLTRNNTEIGDFTANASVDKTIDIEVPTKTSDLINDGETGESTYAEATDIADIWEEIEEIEAASDVTDVVGTYAELEDYDTSKLKDNDIIKVLEDETQNDQITYYRWDTDTETFTLIGAIGPYYTKSEADSEFVPQTRTVNSKALSSNITLTASDVGALPDSTVIPTVNDATLTITQNGTSAGTFTANSATDTTIALTDTTYSDFTGATSSVAGAHGLVPAPTTSDPDKFLKGDGTWDTPPGTTYTAGNGIEINGSTISAKVREVYNHYTSRPTTANTTPTGNGGMYTFQATSSMTTGKPKTDSHILHLEWDNTSGFDSQIALSSWDSAHWMGYRTMSNGAWGNWIYLLNDEAGSVKTANIDALAVTTAKITDGAITEAKIDATAWAKKVNVAGDDLTNQTADLLALTKALGTAGTDYKRWICKYDSATANISNKPAAESFVCEAFCTRWVSSNDYRYQLIMRVKADTNPYVAHVDNSSASITWERLRPAVNDAILTITQNGSTLGTFTANASSNVTIDVPGGGSGEKGDPGKGCPIGTILPYSGSTLPEGYLACDGSAVSRTTYADLFSVIGTIYGAGDGSTTFNLPNLKGKVAVGQDTGDTDFDTLGETGGEKAHTLTINEMPSHRHPYQQTWPATTTEHQDLNMFNVRNKTNNAVTPLSDLTTAIEVTGGNQNDGAVMGATQAYQGGGQAHNNLQPYIVIQYIIKFKDLAATVAEVVNQRTSSSTDVYSADYVNDIGGLVLVKSLALSDIVSHSGTISSIDGQVYMTKDGKIGVLNIGQIRFDSAANTNLEIKLSTGLPFARSESVVAGGGIMWNYSATISTLSLGRWSVNATYTNGNIDIAGFNNAISTNLRFFGTGSVILKLD